MNSRTDRPARFGAARTCGGSRRGSKRSVSTLYPFDEEGRWMVPAPSFYLQRTVRSLIGVTLLLALLVFGVTAVI
jgi:hypothetical protein